MTADVVALKRLLTRDLPLERVGPHLRHAARRALHANDAARMEQAARLVVAELLRRGDLLRIAVQGGADEGGRFYLLRHTTRLVDVSVLGDGTLPLELATPLNGGAVPRSDAAEEFDDFAGMLVAMEQAQDLEIGDPHSGEQEVVLDGILRLLGQFTPQFDLFIQLHDPLVLPGPGGSVFHLAGEAAGRGWLGLRSRGQSAWIPNAGELPPAIQMREAALRSRRGAGPGSRYTAAAVVPLLQPAAAGEALEAGEEAGLFYLVATDDWGRDPLLRLAQRLSRFVTRRWQRQVEVNQRIHTDSLTGVHNRGFFDSQFTLELERARRSGIPLTLVIADIDHFKDTNDRFGHLAGDRVLQMVARRLQEELRRIDHVCRIGGEEFALILPDTSQEAGQEVLTRLLNAVLETTVETGTGSVRVPATFSYGAVTFPDAGADAFELYRKADAMLYLSKDLGRNQCHIWSSEGNHRRLLPHDRPA